MDLTERRAGQGARHPWEVARAKFFVELVKDAADILDVGAGDAYVASSLLEASPNARVVAWDASYTDEEVAALTRDRLRATRARPSGQFDAALVLDVLEHVLDDRALLADVARLVRPGGDIVVSVPAWPQLMSLHDIQLRHQRRYTPKTCRAALKAANLEIVRSGGLFHSLLAPRALTVALSNTLLVPLGDGVGGWRGGPAVTSLVTAALRVDTRLSRVFSRAHVDVPGLSFWALCRKPG